jgi:hypothetical protein
VCVCVCVCVGACVYARVCVCPCVCVCLQDQEDMHWKFYLSMLRLEYLRDDRSLCVPLNLIPTPRAIFDCGMRFRAGECCSGEEDVDTAEVNDDTNPLSATSQRSFIVRPTNSHKPVSYFLQYVTQ